jgi:hypothetical protein
MNSRAMSSALTLGLARERGRANEGSLVVALADELTLVVTLHDKAKLSADNRQEASLRRNSHPDWRCSDVAQINESSDCVLPFQQIRTQAFDAGPLDQANHESGGEHGRHDEADKGTGKGRASDAFVDYD